MACPRCWASVVPDPIDDEQGLGVDVHRRPLATGEILHLATTIYRRCFAALVKLTALVVVPAQVLVALILSVVPEEGEVFVERPFPSFFGPPTTIDVPALLVLLAGRLVILGLGFFATQLAIAACFEIIRGTYLGENVHERKSLSFALRQIRPLMWLAGVPTLLIGAGLLLGFVPGIALYLLWTVAVPVLLVEGERGWSALRRSARLVRRYWWVVLAVLVASRMITSTLALVAVSVFRFVGSFAANEGIGGFLVESIALTSARTLLTPFLVATTVVVYVDLCLRKDGVDALSLFALQPATATKAKVKPRTVRVRKPRKPPALMLALGAMLLSSSCTRSSEEFERAGALAWEQETVRAETSVVIGVSSAQGSSELRLVGVASVDLGAEQAEVTVRFIPREGYPAPPPCRMVVDGEVTYLKLPNEKRWLRANLSGVEREPSAIPTDPFAPIGFLQAVSGSVKPVAREEVRGVSTMHWEASVEASRLVRAGGRLRKLGFVTSFVEGAMPIDVWIDPDGLPRRIAYLGRAKDPQRSINVASSAELFDYGKPVKIEVPASSKVIPEPNPSVALITCLGAPLD